MADFDYEHVYMVGYRSTQSRDKLERKRAGLEAGENVSLKSEAAR